MSDHLGVNILALLLGLGGAITFLSGLLSLAVGGIIWGIIVIALAWFLYQEDKWAWLIVFAMWVITALSALVGVFVSSVIGIFSGFLGFGALLGTSAFLVAVVGLIISAIIVVYLYQVKNDFDW